MPEIVRPGAVIFGRLARLEQLEPGLYARRRWGLAAFGDDEDALKPWYELVLAGYRHERIRVKDTDSEYDALGLLPPEGSLRPAYVEVDELSEPLLVTEQGLEAVRAAEMMVLNTAQAKDDALHKVIVSARGEKPTLRMALFERLFRYFVELGGSGSQATLPAQLFELLPWEAFDSYIDRLIDLARATKPVPAPAALPEPVDCFRHYFTYIRPGLAYELISSVYELESYRTSGDQTGFDSVLRRISSFLYELWHAKADFFPAPVRRKLYRLLDALASDFLERKARAWEGGETLNPEQVRRTNLAISGANLCISRLKEVTPGEFDLRTRLSNSVRAALACDRAQLFGTDHEYVQYLHHELGELAKATSGGVDSLLGDPSFVALSEAQKLDSIINAADVCRWRAQILFCLAGDAAAASVTLEQGEACYEGAKAILLSLPDVDLRKTCLLYQRYARAMILEGAIYASLGEGRTAENALHRALQCLEQLAAKERDYATEMIAVYSREVLRAEVSIALLEKCGRNDNLGYQIECLLRDLVSKRPSDPKAYEMLYSYYYRVKGDVHEALTWVDQWAEEWQRTKRWKKSADWLQYRAAHDAMLASSQDRSLVVESVQRYAQVLKDQTRNFNAASELIEFLHELEDPELDEVTRYLEPMLRRVEDPECPVTHAVIRILFFADSLSSPRSVETAGQALLVYVRGTDHLLVQAKDELSKLDSKVFAFALEILSKWYFTMGRMNPMKTELTIAERLVNLYLETQGDEVVFLTRKFDLALERRDLDDAEVTLTRLQRLSPQDPIVALKTAVLRIKQGKLQNADEVLEQAVGIGAEPPHPALLDRRAHIAVRQAKFPEAKALYLEILLRNEFDAVARFGLGRAYFEWGEDYWCRAFQEWVWALRLRTSSGPQCNPFLANVTARCISSLCQESLADTDIGRRIRSELGRVIRQESVEVASSLVNALATLGITERSIVSTVLEASRESCEALLVRRVAQFLMARTVYLCLGVEKGERKEELATFVQWCLKKNVLPEYLSGAKGSYGRALLRQAMLTGKTGVSKALKWNEISIFRNSLDQSLRDLYDHISRSGEYSPDYYRRAYDIFKRIGHLTVDEWVWFAEGLTKGTASNVWANIDEKDREVKDILASFPMTISLWPLTHILKVHDGAGQLGGWVDRDALAMVERQFRGNSWRVHELEVHREVAKLPEESEILLYSEAGIFFRQEAQKVHCYIETLSNADLEGERGLQAVRAATLTA